MNSTRPNHFPTDRSGTEAGDFMAPFAQSGNDGGPLPHFRRFPGRIEGRFCPFCTGRIPVEYVYCPHCGKGV